VHQAEVRRGVFDLARERRNAREPELSSLPMERTRVGGFLPIGVASNHEAVNVVPPFAQQRRRGEHVMLPLPALKPSHDADDEAPSRNLQLTAQPRDLVWARRAPGLDPGTDHEGVAVRSQVLLRSCG
jgi:hypothetical protein